MTGFLPSQTLQHPPIQLLTPFKLSLACCTNFRQDIAAVEQTRLFLTFCQACKVDEQDAIPLPLPSAFFMYVFLFQAHQKLFADGCPSCHLCSFTLPKVRMQTYECLPHMSQLLPRSRSFALPSSVHMANSSWGMCGNHSNTNQELCRCAMPR